MPGVLALCASFGWGTADFLGGLASRRLPAMLATFASQTVGLITMAVAVIVMRPDPTALDTVLGVAAGIAGPIGLLLLFRALAMGPMNVAAPTAAVASTATTVILGVVLRGEAFTAISLVAALCGVASVVAVSQTPDAETDDHAPGHVRRTLRTGLACGVLLGLANLLFAQTSPDSGAWSVAVARAVAAAMLLVPALRARPADGIHPPSLRYAGVGGVMDGLATMAITLAFQRGSVLLVGVLGGLFPAVTVLLARVVLREHMGRPQFVGLAFAIATIALFAVA